MPQNCTPFHPYFILNKLYSGTETVIGLVANGKFVKVGTMFGNNQDHKIPDLEMIQSVHSASLKLVS